MQGAFHWLRIQVFCYATENEDLIHDTMVELLDNDEFDVEVCDSEHGNRMIILQQELKKQKEFVALFSKFPKKLIDAVIDDIENRIDNDCVIYLRLNKQKAVQGEYAIAHHGDVISVTGKVVSHPARKEIAVANLTEFLKGIEKVKCTKYEPSE